MTELWWRETLKRITGFGAVGLITNLIGYGLYLLVTWLGVAPIPAMTLLFMAGTLISFLGNRFYVFAGSRQASFVPLRYLLIYLFGYLLNLGILWFFAERMGLPHQAVQGVAIFLVAGVLFILLRLLVFQAHPDSGQAR